MFFLLQLPHGIYLSLRITISNFQKSRKFYGELFGLTLKFENERPEMGLKFAMLEDKNTQKLIQNTKILKK